MALAFKSDRVANRHLMPPASPASSGMVYVQPFSVTLGVALALGDLVGLAVLPANCVPVDYKAYNTDMDTNVAPALVTDIGILDKAGTALVAHSLLVDGSTIGQSAGFQLMDDFECALNPAAWLAEALCPGREAEKIVALEVKTAAATPAAGTIKGLLYYRAMDRGV